MPEPKITRNRNSRAAAESFLRALFNTPGTALSWSEVTTRAATARIPTSFAVLSEVAQEMVGTGFLESGGRGFYRRPEPCGVPLGFQDPVPAPAQSLELVRLAGIQSALLRLEAKVDALLARGAE